VRTAIVLGGHAKLVPLIFIEWRKPTACTREKIMEKVDTLFPEYSLKA
jgi:hypothetical protein